MKKILMIITFFTMLCLFNSKVIAYKEYKIGDIIEYKGVNYYVLKNSNTSDDTITLLKAEPLTYEEVGTYSAGTGAQTSDDNGYGGMQYHASSNDYTTSYIKATVDAWKTAKAPLATEARLLTVEDVQSLGYEWYDNGSVAFWQKTDSTPSWMYNNNYYYWTMSPYNDSDSNVWFVGDDGSLYYSYVYADGVVRPVIVLKKADLLNIEETNDSDNKQDSKDSEIISDSEYDLKKNTDNHSEIVYVDNTVSKKSVIIILIGFLLAGVGIITYYIIMKKTERK